MHYSVMYLSQNVIQNLDVDVLYEVPLAMEKEHLADVVCKCLHMDCPAPEPHAWKEWNDMITAWKNPEKRFVLLSSANMSHCMMHTFPLLNP